MYGYGYIYRDAVFSMLAQLARCGFSCLFGWLTDNWNQQGPVLNEGNTLYYIC